MKKRVFLMCFNGIGGKCFEGFKDSIASAKRFAKECDLFSSYIIFSEDKKTMLKRGFV